MVGPGRCLVALAGASLALAACSGAGAPSAPSLGAPRVSGPLHRAVGRPADAQIQHVVVMIQENRSFDNLFATFPGADGAVTGKLHNGKIVPLKAVGLPALDINHTYPTYLQDYDNGNMDGFDLSKMGTGQNAGKYPYQYVDPAKIQPYWLLARRYVLADHMFQTQGSGSFTAHQDLIAGATAIDPNDSIVDDPSSAWSWGCDAKKGTVTSLITTTGQYLFDQGPFPCLSYPTGTLRDLLDGHHVSWKYYTPEHRGNTVGALWNAFDAIFAVRYGPEWQTNISIPETNIYTDISNGTLPAVSWVIPDHADSDHPNGLHAQYNGPSWIASVVNAIGTSSYWDNTTIVVLWDDWGGFYDHVPPAFLDNAGGLGFRVPMLIVSPYVVAGSVDRTQYEFGSILRYIEETFDLGSLGTTDARATSIGNAIHLNFSPAPFNPIPSERSRHYFMHRRPSYEPVDTE
jgi:phospholipase C